MSGGKIRRHPAPARRKLTSETIQSRENPVALAEVPIGMASRTSSGKSSATCRVIFEPIEKPTMMTAGGTSP